MSFEKLASRLEQLLATKSQLVVAIGGFGGSGKTTLAERLKSRFPDCNLIQLDNFLVDRGQGSTWAGGYDWNRFQQVLKDIRTGKDLHYKFYDWPKDSLSDGFIDEKLQKLVIVEGSRILQPQLMSYYDFSVWIDVGLDEGTSRGQKRDEKNWQDKLDHAGLKAHLDTWHTVWAPKDKEYFEKFRPDKLADFIYENRAE